MIHAEVKKHEVIKAKRNSRQRHRIRTDHPVFVQEKIFLVNRRFKSAVSRPEPKYSHRHKTGAFAVTAFCKKSHVKSAGRANEQNHEHINFTGDDMHLLPLFQYPGGKLQQSEE